LLEHARIDEPIVSPDPIAKPAASRGAGWVPSVILVRGWFPLRVGTALGIASAGIGVGIVALVPLAQLLIDHVGWRWTPRGLGLAIIGWSVPATLLTKTSCVRPSASTRPARRARYLGIRGSNSSWTR
jgi:MFS family permease